MDGRLLDVVSRGAPVDEVHAVLMQIAAERANQDPTLPRDIYVVGDAFRPTPERSKKGGLCLTYEEMPLVGMREPDRSNLINHMQRIGRDAVTQVIRENPEVIVRLTLDEAKANRNYFDRFRQ